MIEYDVLPGEQVNLELGHAVNRSMISSYVIQVGGREASPDTALAFTLMRYSDVDRFILRPVHGIFSNEVHEKLGLSKESMPLKAKSPHFDAWVGQAIMIGGEEGMQRVQVNDWSVSERQWYEHPILHHRASKFGQWKNERLRRYLDSKYRFVDAVLSHALDIEAPHAVIANQSSDEVVVQNTSSEGIVRIQYQEPRRSI